MLHAELWKACAEDPYPEPEKSAPGRSVTWLITSLGPCLSLTSLHLSERGSERGSSSKPSP